MTSDKVWTPKDVEQSSMWKFMRHVERAHDIKFKNYQQLHTWSVDAPTLFWQSLCEFFDIQFATPAKQVLNSYPHMLDARWFEGATFNFAEKMLAGEDAHPALICIDENNNRQLINYQQLKSQVSQCAQGLKAAGVKTGDRVSGVLPNSQYAVIAMLASASIGAIWSSCSPDFGINAIIDRFAQLNPKVIFVSDGHHFRGKEYDALPKNNQIIKDMPGVKQVVICPVINNKSRHETEVFIAWDDFLKPATTLEFTQLPFDHPLYILFSSGTTGKPKCIVHGAGGTFLQHIKELALHSGISKNDNVLFYTTCGWMMWNWMVSALALGATIILYEGAPFYPSAGRLCQLVEQEKITVFGTGSKVISAIEKAGVQPNREYDMSSLHCILATASPLLPKNYDFVYQQMKNDVQLSSISGGTDIISCFAIGNPMLPIYRGELQCLGLGMAVEVFDEKGNSIQESPGELVCTKPFPSMPIGFWQDEDKSLYRNAYFKRYPAAWAQGDRVEITAHGGLVIYGRSDAVLNPGGVRIGTAEIYRQVEKISDVVDSVVIGQEWQDDVRVVLFIQLQEGLELSDSIQTAIRQMIRTNASPRHVPELILQVPNIPRTISGKIVELAVRDTVHGREVVNLDSLANPEALEYFKNRPELII